MKRSFNKGIKHVGVRQARMAAIEHSDLDKDMKKAACLVLIPPAIRHLPDGGSRGQKSLTRVCEINNKRRFKVRPSGASGVRCS